MKSLKNKQSKLQLEKLNVETMEFLRLDDGINRADENAQITFSKNMMSMEDYYKVVLGIEINSSEKYKIKLELAGFFKIDGEENMAQDLLEINTLAILFPYLRSQLTLLTSQPGFEPVMLPVMNINALFRE